jgi:hypothetical protein
MSEVAVLRLEAGKANAMTSETLDRIDALVRELEGGGAGAGVLIAC